MAEQRQLTEDEQKRSELFREVSEKLTAEGYEVTQLTTTAVVGNVVGTLIGFVFAVPFVALYVILNGWFGSDIGHPIWMIVAFVAFLVCIVVHELIHGGTWMIFTKGKKKSIAFGFILKTLTPYCSCKEPLKAGHYVAGLIMPCIILGVIPSVIATIIVNPILLLFGAVMIICAGGDLMILCLIIAKKPRHKEVLFLDHPTDIGLMCFMR